jgi:hypothetical protein
MGRIKQVHKNVLGVLLGKAANMIRLLVALAAFGIVLAVPAHADPPAPLQCKVVGGFNTQVCRYADGHVTQCDAITSCHPVPVQVNPDFSNS